MHSLGEDQLQLSEFSINSQKQSIYSGFFYIKIRGWDRSRLFWKIEKRDNNFSALSK